MAKNFISYVKQDFNNNFSIYWNHFSRLTIMLIISNFSLFFLTKLVIRERYFYTHISLGLLFLVHLALILPLGLVNRLWFYGLCLLFELASVYFFGASIWYWVVSNIH
jgi:hypothetical protein